MKRKRALGGGLGFYDDADSDSDDDGAGIRGRRGAMSDDDEDPRPAFGSAARDLVAPSMRFKLAEVVRPAFRDVPPQPSSPSPPPLPDEPPPPLPGAEPPQAPSFAAEFRQRREEERRQRESEAAAAARDEAAAPLQADFEKFTKGFGSRMLARMNFKGRLGRREQGIERAIEPVLRQHGVGLGYNGPEKVDAPKTLDQEMAAQREAQQRSEKERRERPGAAAAWRRDAPKPKPKPAYQMQQIDTIRESARHETVLDLTGRGGPRVTTMGQLQGAGAGAGAGATKGGDDDGGDDGEGENCQELQYNVRVLREMSEAEIRAIHKKREQQQQMQSHLEHQRNELYGTVREEKQVLDRLEALRDMVDMVCSTSEAQDLDRLHAGFLAMQTSFPDEYAALSLSALAKENAFGLIKALFAGWEPLAEPDRGLTVVKAWRSLLAPAVYQDLLAQSALTPIRRAIAADWDPLAPDACVALVTAWSGALPRPALDTLVDQTLFPKLRAALGAWHPRRDALGAHVWLHPWLPVMRTRLETLYPEVRQRLAQVVGDLDVQRDARKAVALVAPWKRVFERPFLEEMLRTRVYVRLKDALAQVPATAQGMEVMAALLEWKKVVPTDALAALLGASFMPPWLRALRALLADSKGSVDAAMQWYLGWKRCLGSDLAAHQAVSEFVVRGLDLLNRASAGERLEGVAMAVDAGPRADAGKHKERDRASVPQRPDDVDISFKDLVDEFAQEHGIAFVPKHGVRHEGRQVYRFGKVSVYLDGDVVFARVKGVWEPVGLDEMVE